MKTLKRILLFAFLILFGFTNAQTYTGPTNYNGSNDSSNSNNDSYYISNFTLGNIDNDSDATAPIYEYYSGTSTILNQGETYNASITYQRQSNNSHNIAVWIDYNGDGTYNNDASETIYIYSLAGSPITSEVLNFSFTVPLDASTTTNPRIRMAIKHGTNPVTSDSMGWQAGEFEEYNLDIRPELTPPVAICKNTADLNFSLDILGNLTLTGDDINNGSTDNYDTPANLTLSLDQNTFTCDDIGTKSVTLTVTDSDGLTDSCTTSVNISPYSGSFVAPTLETINAYCSYTATTPVMDFQCSTQITATTSDTTTFSTPGNYTINWSFTNGGTTETSTQTINVTNPSAVTNLATTTLTEFAASVNWDSVDAGPFTVRYRPTGASGYTEIETTDSNITLTSLNNDTAYEIGVKVNADCATFETINFTTEALSYCTSGGDLNATKDTSFYISNVTLGDINNTTDTSVGPYVYYPGTSTTNAKETNLTGTITYQRPSWTSTSLAIWVDYNLDGVFDDNTATEKIILNEIAAGATTITENISVTIPNTATSGKTRIRIAMYLGGGERGPCNFAERADIEDYDLIIQPAPTPPTAICQSLNIELGVDGTATITADDINNGSSDAVDYAEDLILSINKPSFTCMELGDNTVTLTVTDTDGLTDTCTATVNVAAYSGTFIAPTIDPVNTYCEYTASAPILNYQCRTIITGTTTDTTTFTTDGSYTINWEFNDGTSTVTSTQNIIISTPTIPTGLTVSDIAEKTANLEWASTETGPFKIRYKETSAAAWTEVNAIENLTHSLTNLNNGSDYEIQVAIDTDCATYSASSNFTTTTLPYCSITGSWKNSTPFNLSSIQIGDINNTPPDGDNLYEYYSSYSTSISLGGSLTGSVTYKRQNWFAPNLTIWIDYNQDGNFDEVTEKAFTASQSAGTSDVTETINISIPYTAALGKTRMRIAFHENTAATACGNMQRADVEDYNLYITPSPLENVMITQILRSDTGFDGNNQGDLIELKNTGTTTITANSIVLALFVNVTGSLIGVTPDGSYTHPTDLLAGEVVLLKNSTTAFTKYTGTALDADNVADFNNENDVLVATSTPGTEAWNNRVDVFTNIVDNTSFVRKDYITKNNDTFTDSEWTAFVDNDLNRTRLIANGGPDRLFEDPLIKNIDNNLFKLSNSRLGVHNLGSTESTGGNSFTNGFPDRSRQLIINTGFNRSGGIDARSLIVKENAILRLTSSELRVTDSITIENNGQIRLRNGVQLIQTHTGTSQVYGTGKLYIQQESTTASPYLFNYFSSPVNNVASNTYTLADILKDGSTPLQATNEPQNINFVSDIDGSKTDPISISNQWIYSFTNDGNDTSNFELKESTGTFGAIDGFTMKGPGVAQNYIFSGTPKDGELSVPISANQFYLVGNPYPSAIRGVFFIEDNLSSTDGSIYLWDHVDVAETGINGHYFGGYIGGYAVQNLTMRIPADSYSENNTDPNNDTPYIDAGTYKTPSHYIPVGQGFFVSGNTTGGAITFKNRQRRGLEIGPNSIFFKTKKLKTLNDSNKTVTNNDEIEPLNTMPMLKLGISYTNKDNNRLHQQIGVTFDEHNSFAYEPGYDAAAANDGSTSAYWKFNNDDRSYVITGVSEITENLEVPLEIKVGEANKDIPLAIDIDEWQNIDREVYLLDKSTNQTQPLDKGVAYLNLAPGTYTDRFAITFKKHETLSTQTIEANSIVINASLENIKINNYGTYMISAVEMYTISGQRINEWEILTSQKEISLEINNISKEVYVLKLITNKGSISKKFIIE